MVWFNSEVPVFMMLFFLLAFYFIFNVVYMIKRQKFFGPISLLIVVDFLTLIGGGIILFEFRHRDAIYGLSLFLLCLLYFLANTFYFSRQNKILFGKWLLMIVVSLISLILLLSAAALYTLTHS